MAVVSKHFNFTTFSKDLLPLSKFRSYPAVGWQNNHILSSLLPDHHPY